MNAEKEFKPFGLADKIGYMFGDFGNDFTFIFASLFLMVFYTKVLGISAGVVGVMFVVVRLLDAVTDVTMGRIVDRMRPGKDGRFRPWIRRMCGPVALASFLMYQSGLSDASMTVKIVYMYVTYILWGSIFYTSINIPYGSMASVISDNAEDRATLSTFRSLGATFASLVIGVLAPLLVYTKDVNGNQIVEGSRMTFVAGVFSLGAILCYVLCYMLTTERVQISPQKGDAKSGIGSTLKRLATNRALLGIILASILLLLASLLTQAINQYVFLDYFNNNAGISVMSAVGIIPALFMAPFVLPITRGVGKKEASAIGCILAGAASILLYFLHVKNMWLFILISVIGYTGFSFFNLVVWSLITDVIDDLEVKSGTREDGTVYAMYSFARKLGQAAAGGLGGFALAMTGYDETVQVQTREVADGIYNVATLYPGILYIAVGLVLLFLFPLGKKRVLENTAILKERRRKG